MKKILMVFAGVMSAMMAAVAEPSVEITKVKLADAHDGMVEYAYTVSGDFEGNTFTVPLPICENDSAVRFFRARFMVD